VSSGSTLIDDGRLTIAGALIGHGAIAGAGRLSIAAGATLEADSTVAAKLSVAFEGDAATLALTTPQMFGATLSGLAAGDTIDLLGLQATGAKVDARDRLVIVDGATRVAQLQLSGAYAGATFAVGADGQGGTDITLESPGPPTAARPAMAPHALIAAMASLGATAGSAGVAAAPAEAWKPTLLGAGPKLA
jgi:hypothetical protein